MPDFIPRSDTAALEWASNFTGRLIEDPAVYGVEPQLAAQLVTLKNLFAEALAAARAPISRTRPAISAKVAARAAFVEKARAAGKMIRAGESVTAAMLLSLGMSAGRGSVGARRIVVAPAVPPVVRVGEVNGSKVGIRLHNTDAPDRQGLIRDVAAVRLYTFVGKEPPAALDQWTFAGGGSRARTAVDFGTKYPPGTQVWIRAQWISRRQQVSPPSHPVMAFLGYTGGTVVGQES